MPSRVRPSQISGLQSMSPCSPYCSTSLTTAPPRVAISPETDPQDTAWLTIIEQSSSETKTARASHCFWPVLLCTFSPSTGTPLPQNHLSYSLTSTAGRVRMLGACRLPRSPSHRRHCGPRGL
ncbi:uncharacterized protein CCOS01_13765 [Colletotrichum costaricense]|uniref:Uncharacterized protein n=1 Tax=Colletotrichum costaricense TaxID=1209916 RepID=A0AAI9YKM9_9PEZI|nr:uncharacterized protein CCOS01_13765 [Colletotrichum costaricense]KAK1514484.1 hypothetical protein CCOS01_13765 [Colletotrichum costaricense]